MRQYIPQCDIDVTRIEVHTNGGHVSLLADMGGSPGMSLFTGVLPTSAGPSWIGADVSPPLPLKGGRTYWIQQGPGTCSTAAGGQVFSNVPTVHGSSGNAWTSHIIGSCP